MSPSCAANTARSPRRSARAGRQGAHAAWPGARQRAQARLVGRLCAAEAELPRHERARRLSDRRAGRLYRLDAVLPDLGAAGQISRHSRRCESRRGGALALRRRARHARQDRRRDTGSRPAPWSASGRPMRTATISWSMPTRRARSRSPCCTRCASSSPSARAAPMSRSPISSRRATAGWPITSAASPSPPASARTRSPTASSAPTTTTPRSWSRRWPTGWPRPSPSGCTSACAGSSGATRRTRR